MAPFEEQRISIFLPNGESRGDHHGNDETHPNRDERKSSREGRCYNRNSMDNQDIHRRRILHNPTALMRIAA